MIYPILYILAWIIMLSMYTFLIGAVVFTTSYLLDLGITVKQSLGFGLAVSCAILIIDNMRRG